VCFKSPHHPYQPDERDKNLYEDVSIPKRPSDTPEAYASMSSHIMEGSLNRWCYFDERKDEETKNHFEKNFLRCVKSLDRSVGEIMGSLKELKLDKNTIVVFLSDNGYLWGEHGLGGKWLHYEESIRIPMIISWPGKPNKYKDKLLSQKVLNIDIAPTILELAGINIPEVMNGKSMTPLFNYPESDFRDDFFLEHVGIVDAEYPIPDSYGVRTGDWKYIRYINSGPETEEIYNIATDHMELNNLVNDPEYADTKEYLKKRCDEYINSFKDKRP